MSAADYLETVQRAVRPINAMGFTDQVNDELPVNLGPITEQEVLNYTLPASIDCVFLADGDHSFKPRKASGKTQHEHMVYAAKLCVDFISRLI